MLKASSFLFVLIFIGLVLLQCSKDEVSKPVIEEPEEVVLPGFDYWLNSNEDWYYDYVLPDIPPYGVRHRATSYKVLRDVVIQTDSMPVNGKVLLQKTYSLDMGGDSLDSDGIEVEVFFIKETRTLYARYPDRFSIPEYSEHILARFEEIDHNVGCGGVRMTKRDTVKFGNNYYVKYENSIGNEIFEGISLGVIECRLMPPNFAISGYGFVHARLDLFRYTSDQYTYEWKR